MPVSIVHLLPQWLWRRRGLELHQARLNPRGAVKPNSQWNFQRAGCQGRARSEQCGPSGAVPVPVLELRPRFLSWWSRLVMGNPHRWTPPSCWPRTPPGSNDSTPAEALTAPSWPTAGRVAGPARPRTVRSARVSSGRWPRACRRGPDIRDHVRSPTPERMSL